MKRAILLALLLTACAPTGIRHGTDVPTQAPAGWEAHCINAPGPECPK